MDRGEQEDRIANVLYAFKAVTRIGCDRFSEEQGLDPRSEWMLVLVSGAADLHADGMRHTLASGDAVRGRAGEALLRIGARADECSALLIECSVIAMEGNEQAAPSAEVASSVVEATALRAHELKSLAERLYQLATSGDSQACPLQAHLIVQQMMLWWLGAREETQERTGSAEHAVKSTLRYMEAHYAEPLTREELASRSGIACTYFSVVCKKMTGLSPSEYIERLRAHRAAELLLQGSGSRNGLSEVARSSGFRDAWYMSKRFRKYYRVSPSTYRTHFVPERVASLEYPYTHHLLALGATPCAGRLCRHGAVLPAEDREAIAELSSLLSIEAQEQLLWKQQPQIIVTQAPERVRERVRWIAPVVHIPWLSLNWRQHMMAFGRLLHRQSAAIAGMESLDRLGAQTRRQAYAMIPQDTRISVFKIENKRCYVYGIRDAGCIFYEFLGYAPHPGIKRRIAQDNNFHSMEIPLSRLSEYAGDLNFVILFPDVTEQSDFLHLNEHWRQFELSSGRPPIYLDYREWLHYDPIHIADQLHKIVPLFSRITG